MPRDHVKFISDLGELSGIFRDSTSLETFLQKIVVMVSEHMHSEVCSIYLYYEDTQKLVLRATKGLHPSSIGAVAMQLGEGLTGLALEESRPICEKNASRNPHFKSFPGIGEEKYESFLAVPIVRGQTRIGVIVIQNTRKNYFSEEDVKAFRAITSQLANTIETAKLLMSLGEKERPKEAVPVKGLKLVQGKVGSSGFAFGEAVVANEHLPSVSILEMAASRKYSLEDFYRAVQLAEKQLRNLQQQIEEQLSDAASLIFAAQILMLKDKGFIEGIVSLAGSGVPFPSAIRRVVEQYVQRFESIASPYLREKKQDVKDIGKRLLENLTGVNPEAHYAGHIIVAQELFPSDILKLSMENVKGIVLLSGGASSHLAILARSFSIPLVIADAPELLTLPPGTKILLDAEIGNIYINPTEDVIKTFARRNKEREALGRLRQAVLPETRTEDGIRVRLLANINLLSDVRAALEFKAEGVGLYRTEFPFIIRSDFPTEEEQFFVYQRLVEAMDGREVIFRTLDIGGDKVLSYYNFGKEENPFLGMRSIRFSLKHKDIFEQQIRAILRSGAKADIKIMFPMISSLDEFLEAKDVVAKCINDLKKANIAHHPNPPIGMMVELPSVLEIIDELAEAADFFSIGTNDFIQYMLAVDRTNEKVADLYLPHHPAVLRALNRVVKAAQKFKKDVSICGDMAHEERYLPYFLGIGIRSFSVNSLYIPKIQSAIAQIKIKEAEIQAKKILESVKLSDTSIFLRESV